MIFIYVRIINLNSSLKRIFTYFYISNSNCIKDLRGKLKSEGKWDAMKHCGGGPKKAELDVLQRRYTYT